MEKEEEMEIKIGHCVWVYNMLGNGFEYVYIETRSEFFETISRILVLWSFSSS